MAHPLTSDCSNLTGESPAWTTPTTEHTTPINHTSVPAQHPIGPYCEWPRWKGGDPAERWPN